jgi:hypothetical protein
MIPVRSGWNSANLAEFSKIQRTLFFDALLPAKELFSDKFRLAGDQKKEKKKLFRFHRNPARFQRDFAGITVEGLAESLLRVF